MLIYRNRGKSKFACSSVTIGLWVILFLKTLEAKAVDCNYASSRALNDPLRASEIAYCQQMQSLQAPCTHNCFENLIGYSSGAQRAAEDMRGQWAKNFDKAEKEKTQHLKPVADYLQANGIAAWAKKNDMNPGNGGQGYRWNDPTDPRFHGLNPDSPNYWVEKSRLTSENNPSAYLIVDPPQQKGGQTGASAAPLSANAPTPELGRAADAFQGISSGLSSNPYDLSGVEPSIAEHLGKAQEAGKAENNARKQIGNLNHSIQKIEKQRESLQASAKNLGELPMKTESPNQKQSLEKEKAISITEKFLKAETQKGKAGEEIKQSGLIKSRQAKDSHELGMKIDRKKAEKDLEKNKLATALGKKNKLNQKDYDLKRRLMIAAQSSGNLSAKKSADTLSTKPENSMASLAETIIHDSTVGAGAEVVGAKEGQGNPDPNTFAADGLVSDRSQIESLSNEETSSLWLSPELQAKTLFVRVTETIRRQRGPIDSRKSLVNQGT